MTKLGFRDDRDLLLGVRMVIAWRGGLPTARTYDRMRLPGMAHRRTLFNRIGGWHEVLRRAVFVPSGAEVRRQWVEGFRAAAAALPKPAPPTAAESARRLAAESTRLAAELAQLANALESEQEQTA